MTNIATPPATGPQSNSVIVPDDDDFEDEVENIINILPNELDRAWLDGLGEDPGLEENEGLLRIAFWDAARAVLEAVLRAGYTLTPPKS